MEKLAIEAYDVAMVWLVLTFGKNFIIKSQQGPLVLSSNTIVNPLGNNKVQTEARILEGDVGKAICNEAARIKPAAVVMGTRGRGIIKR